VVDGALEDLVAFQEEVSARVRSIEQASKGAVPSKEELKRRRDSVEAQLKKIERDGWAWIGDRYSALEGALKALQDKVKDSETVYDELMGKRRAGIHYTMMNDFTLNKVLNLIDKNDPGKIHFPTINLFYCLLVCR
jgi:predicted nuclease with TOPRIM domain